MHFEGTAFRYGRDIDTDVIIPARYLNSSDHAYLASHCLEDLDPTFVGKQGITPTIVAQTNALLEGKELIKCTVQNTSDLDTQEAAFMLADATESEMIQVIGHKFVLYRESQRDDIEHIQLV